MTFILLHHNMFQAFYHQLQNSPILLIMLTVFSGRAWLTTSTNSQLYYISQGMHFYSSAWLSILFLLHFFDYHPIFFGFIIDFHFNVCRFPFCQFFIIYCRYICLGFQFLYRFVFKTSNFFLLFLAHDTCKSLYPFDFHSFDRHIRVFCFHLKIPESKMSQQLGEQNHLFIIQKNHFL